MASAPVIADFRSPPSSPRDATIAAAEFNRTASRIGPRSSPVHTFRATSALYAGSPPRRESAGANSMP